MSWKSDLGLVWGCFSYDKEFVGFFCSSSSYVHDLDSVNSEALNKEQKFHLQFMHSQKSKICSVMLLYNFSGSQKSDYCSIFG